MSNFICPKHLEPYRLELYGELGDPWNGYLHIKSRGISVIFSNGGGWEHVSISRKGRMPSYEDLAEIKNEFWGEDACVMQLFVAKADHVNCHPYCLHLWRPVGQDIPRPPSIFVGPK